MEKIAERLLGVLEDCKQYLSKYYKWGNIPKNIAESSKYDYRNHDGKYWKIDEHTYVINGAGMIFIVKDWKLVAYKYIAGGLIINPVKNCPHLFLAFEFESSDYERDCFVFNALDLDITTIYNYKHNFSLIK